MVSLRVLPTITQVESISHSHLWSEMSACVNVSAPLHESRGGTKKERSLSIANGVDSFFTWHSLASKLDSGCTCIQPDVNEQLTSVFGYDMWLGPGLKIEMKKIRMVPLQLSLDNHILKYDLPEGF